MIVNPRTLFANNYAFLVGIEEYKHFPHLRGAHSDAKILHEVLSWVGYSEENLCLIPTEKTALSDLKREVEEFLGRVRRQCHDTNPDIVIFWAGHGVPTENGSHLIVRSTLPDDESWSGSALSLQWLASQFAQLGPASLTMFFDVCHSIPRRRDDLGVRPRERIIAPMRDDVRTTDVQTMFVGVSTFAYEVWAWNEAHPGAGRSAGILADAVQKAMRGEPCDSNDRELCHNSDDFLVTNSRLAHKLEAAVLRKARAAGVHQQLSVLAHHQGQPSIIGFAVKSHAEKELSELELPVETDLLARLVVDRSGPFQDHMTDFGSEMVKIVRGLIDQPSTKDSFLQEERKLTCAAILELRTDPHIGSYAYFLLYCREEAKRDGGAEEVLQVFYDYLVFGRSFGELGEWLDSQCQLFAIRQASPWSYGIRVLSGRDEHGYAQIIDSGAPIAAGCDVQRTFVTTSPLQRRARLDVWRAGDETSTTLDLDAMDCCYTGVGDFFVELANGSRVWVRIGFDEQGCEVRGCGAAGGTSVYVPMKILLGREGHPDCDWYGHWHLDFGGGWNELRGAEDAGSEPAWVAGLRKLMDECRRSLEALLANSPELEYHRVDLIKRLYLADIVTRMWDESRLAYIVQALIVGLRDQRERSKPWLAWALRNVMGAEPGSGEDGPEETARGAYRQDTEVVLVDYEQWQTAPGASAETSRRAELLARLLRAVTAEGPAMMSAVGRVVELVAMGPEEETETLGEVVAEGAAPAPWRAARLVARLVRATYDLLQEEGADLLPEQRETLLSWVRFAATAMDAGRAGEALDEFFSRLTGAIGVGAWLLAKEYFKVTVHPDFGVKFDALVTRLRLGEGESDTREAAEEMFRRLNQLHVSRLRDEAVPEEGIDLLIALSGLLRPEITAVVLQLLSRDIDQGTAFRVASAIADRDRPNLDDMNRLGVDEKDMIPRIHSYLDWITRSPITWAVKADSGPIAPAQSQLPQQAERHDQMILAVPPGKRRDP